ncbi:MAG: toll/interleukin-1 receptor domain-containing protein [Cyanobacteria bacterium J06641_5]
MAEVFISYSRDDHVAANYFREKLESASLSVWLDHQSLVPGDDWRASIDSGIENCKVVLLLLSPSATESHYVTYEWASAIGKGKPVIPALLKSCELHPVLANRQYQDFSRGGQLPWDMFVRQIRASVTQAEEREEGLPDEPAPDSTLLSPERERSLLKQVLAYLDLRGFQMVSFERVTERIDTEATEAQLRLLVDRNRDVLRHARIMGGKPGLARL